MSAPRILAIGLDSAERSLVERWMASGDLPVLRGLRERGTWATVASPPGFGDDGTWPSFYTAVSPARHARYFYTQVRRGTYRHRTWRDGDLQRAPFWNALSQAARRVAILDVPKCPLARELDGLHLADWLVHGHDEPQPRSWPPDLAAGLVSTYGNRPPSLCEEPDLTEAQFQQLYAGLQTTIDMKRRLVEQCIDDGWDLVLTSFKETHCVGHRFWHVDDAAHPKHDPELARLVPDAVKRTYTAVDAAVGRLLAHAAPDTTVLVFSLLGMGVNYSGKELLDDVLVRLEAGRSGTRARRVAGWRRLWRALPAEARHWAVPRQTRLHKQVRKIECADRLSFTVPSTEFASALRLNVIGREPHGRVAPGAAYHALCADLDGALRELVDPDSGRPIVEDVVRPTALYDGAFLPDLPDLIVVWRRDAPIAGAASPRIGEIRRRYTSYRMGEHQPNGFLCAAGPDIGCGALPEAVSVMDLAPTIAARLGVSLSDVDGAPIAALCGTAA